MSELTMHLDLDAFKYALASVGEERTILVVHKDTGWEKEFKTRTEFWGHHSKKAGGWLAEVNKKKVAKGQEPALPEDFEIIDKQRLKDEPISHILNSVKQSVNSAVKASGATKVEYYIGRGESFRVEKSTILEYKGNRPTTKPLLFDDIVEYMEKKYKPHIITHLECDDAINIAAYGKDNHFCGVEDKDAYGAGSKVFNIRYPQEGIVETDNLGRLWIDTTGKNKKVRGYGRMFKLWQCCSLDNSDNYRANCASDVAWGEMSAYHALKDCKNDRELFEAAYGVFKHLYPEPKVITGWRGDEFEIDALYVFQECFDMCHMLRWEGDVVDLRNTLSNLKIEL